jgi:excisionase family DNA binding protein
MGKSDSRSRIGPQAVVPPDDGMWTPDEVAAYLRVSRRWVYEHAANGHLPSRRYFGSSKVRFVPAEIRAYARGEWKPPLKIA